MIVAIKCCVCGAGYAKRWYAEMPLVDVSANAEDTVPEMLTWCQLHVPNDIREAADKKQSRR